MRRGLRLLGHPLHALLSDLPVGLWALGPLWDAAALWGDQPALWIVGFWTTLAGCVAGLFAAGAGLVDFAAIDPESRASTVGTYHLMLMSSALVVFGIALWVRGGPSAPPGARAYGVLAIDAFAVGLMSVGGWLGGHLVFHHRVGVDAQEDRS